MDLKEIGINTKNWVDLPQDSPGFFPSVKYIELYRIQKKT